MSQENNTIKSSNHVLVFTEDGEVAPKGQWSDARRLAAIEGMLRYRPFEQKHTMVTDAWTHVITLVNQTSPELHPLGATSIKNYIKKAREDIHKVGHEDPMSVIAIRTRQMDELMTRKELQKSSNHQNNNPAKVESAQPTVHAVVSNASEQEKNKGKQREHQSERLPITDGIQTIDDYELDETDRVEQPPKRRRLDYASLNKRREALDRDFSAALLAAEADKANIDTLVEKLDKFCDAQNEFLVQLGSHLDKHTVKIEQIMKKNADETYKCIHQLLANQHQANLQLIHNQQQLFEQIFQFLNNSQQKNTERKK